MTTLNKISTITSIWCLRRISTSLIVNSRFRRKHIADPGIGRQLRMIDNDDPYKEDIQGEEDLADLETDFQNVDKFYSNYQSERKRERQRVGRIITAKKFFSEPKSPNMLTWAEREHIKYLHKKDPEEWNAEVLSKSFPATADIIRRILKNKWKTEDPKKMMRRDEQVHENWRLLAEGRLEAQPDLIDHLKTFLARREEHLKSLKKKDFTEFLKISEPEIQWNGGQMSSILESYENKLLKIQNRSSQKIKDMLPGETSESKLSDQNGEAFLHFEDERVVQVGRISKDTKPVTLGAISEEIKNTSDDLIVLPEHKDNALCGKPVTSRLAMLAGYSEGDINETLTRKNNQLRKRLKGTRNKDNLDEECKFEPEINGEREANYFSKRKGSSFVGKRDHKSKIGVAASSEELLHKLQQRPAAEDDENSNMIFRENDTKEVTAEELGAFLRKNENVDAMESSQESDTKLNAKKEKTPFEFDPIRDERQFDVEARGIEGTFFWSGVGSSELDGPTSGLTTDTPTSGNNPVVQTDTPTTFVKDTVAKSDVSTMYNKNLVASDKTQTSTAFYNYGYPERINVPKDKRGSGLTFRVKDCYYDDDGEFLYRVPGLTSTASPKQG